MSGSTFTVTHHPVSSWTGGTADRNRSHWSTSKTPSYTKSTNWQHHPLPTGNLFTITSVARTAWEALRAFLTGNRQNRQQTTRKPARNAQALFLRHAWVCAQVHSAEFHTVQPVEVLFSTFFSSENGERGRNLLRGREALPASRKTRFQHVQEGGRCTNGSGNGSEVIR